VDNTVEKPLEDLVKGHGCYDYVELARICTI
jgi:hypothetical protein